MEIHAPDKPLHSFEDFAFHILTVILGILIALSLEQLLEWHHHRKQVEEAHANLASEIRDNRAHLQQGVDRAKGAEQQLRLTIQSVRSVRDSHHEPDGNLTWGFAIYPLSSTAWNTAATTGAVAHMTYQDVQSYTRVYGVQDQFMTIQQRTLDKWLELQKWEPRLEHRTFGRLSDAELADIENLASIALIYTQTDESIARSLVDEYNKTLK